MRLFTPIAFAAVAFAAASPARADDGVAARPTILLERWQEDWSALADPSLRTDPLDPLKYIRLGSDPMSYVSFGLTVRERFEASDATPLGVGADPRDDYVLSRVQVHADLHLASHLQIFTQLASYLAPGKTRIGPIDQDALDVEQAFAALTIPIETDTLVFRVGRQEIALDRQRFVGIRDGPNVRQPYDAIWAHDTHGAWNASVFYSQPVQVHDDHAFDDTSSTHLTFSGLRVERTRVGPGLLSAYVARYRNDNATYLAATGAETRYLADARYAGAAHRWDWDVEAMDQVGSVGLVDVRAWAVGNLAGYTWKAAAWEPRLGLQLDAASGTHDRAGHTIGTFNALFPNGYYETLPGYPGYANFVQVKPSWTVAPTRTLTVMLAVAAVWRDTVADAVYMLPSLPIPGTAGEGGPFTGTYEQLHVDWFMTTHWSSALEAVHFAVGDALRNAGAHDNNYLGVELRYAL